MGVLHSVGGLSRRKFITRAMTAGLGLAAGVALAGCGEAQVVEVVKEVPVEKIVTQIVEKAVIQEKVVTVQVEKPQKAVVDLRIGSYVWGDHVIAAYTNIISQFETRTNYNVRFEYAPSGEFEKKLRTQIAAGNAPDVFMTIPDTVPPLVANNQLIDLTEYIKASPVKFDEWYPVSWQALADRTGQRYYAVPVTFDCEVTFFNLQKFDEAGAAYPPEDDSWTYDDYVETALKVTKREGDKITQWGTTLGWRPWEQFVEANNGMIFDAWFFYDHPTMNTPEAIGGIQFIADLLHKHKVAAIPGTSPKGNLFQSNLAAIGGQEGSWKVQSWGESLKDFKWDVVMPPLNPTTGRRPSTGQDNNFSMVKTSKFPDEAWELMYDLGLTEEAQSTLAIALETPAMKKAAEGPYKEQILSAAPNGWKVLPVMEFWTTHVPTGYVNQDVWAVEANNLLDPVWLGTKQAADAVPEIQTKFEELVAEAKKQFTY